MEFFVGGELSYNVVEPLTLDQEICLADYIGVTLDELREMPD